MSCTLELKPGDPFSVESKIIEEIPEPQPVVVTEYKIARYTGSHCQKEVVATDSSCPKESCVATI
jgi:transposase